MRWAYHRCAIIVALDEDMAAHLKKVTESKQRLFRHGLQLISPPK